MFSPSHSSEWLEADGLGGFASGTVDGNRARRYHALLLSADPARGNRMALVNGLEVWLKTVEGSLALSSQRYAPDVVYPEDAQSIVSFEPDPWPQWVFELPDGTRIEHGLFVRPGHPETFLYWRFAEGRGGTLAVRPLLLGTIVPSEQPHNMAWGDDDSKTLYMCARSGLYRIRLSIPGIPPGPTSQAPKVRHTVSSGQVKSRASVSDRDALASNGH
jgi:hypothetical protein